MLSWLQKQRLGGNVNHFCCCVLFKIEFVFISPSFVFCSSRFLPSPTPFAAGGGQADPEPAEGQQFPFRLPRWGGVSTHEPRGQGSPAERSLQCGGVHRGGRGFVRQKGDWPNSTSVARLVSTSYVSISDESVFALGKISKRATCCFGRSFQKTTRQWRPWPKLLRRTCSSHTWMTTREGTSGGLWRLSPAQTCGSRRSSILNCSSFQWHIWCNVSSHLHRRRNRYSAG